MATKLGDIVLNKKTGTTLTLHTDKKWVPYDGFFTIAAQDAVIGSGSGSADVNVKTGGTGNISGVIGTKSGTQPTSGYYIKMEGSGSVTPSVATGGWVEPGSMSPISASATKYFPVNAATITQNAPTVDASGLVTAIASTTAGYTPANASAASNTLQLSTEAGKTVSPTESEQTAVAKGKYTTGPIKVGAISPTYVGSGIARNDSSDLTSSGATVTAPAGYYAEDATKTIASGSVVQNAPTIDTSSGVVTATSTVSAGYVSSGTKSSTLRLDTQHGDTFTPTRSAQTVVPAGTYTLGNIVVGAIPSNYYLLTEVYPVGSMYASTAPTNPSTTLGFGTWELVRNTPYIWFDVSSETWYAIKESDWSFEDKVADTIYVFKRTA